jgi:hypothetical protein
LTAFPKVPTDTLTESNVERALDPFAGGELSEIIKRLPTVLGRSQATKLSSTEGASGQRAADQMTEKPARARSDRAGAISPASSSARQSDNFAGDEQVVEGSDNANTNEEPDVDVSASDDLAGSPTESDDKPLGGNFTESQVDDASAESESFLTPDEVRDLGDPTSFGSATIASGAHETSSDGGEVAGERQATESSDFSPSNDSEAKALPPWPILTVEVREAQWLVKSEMDSFAEKLEDLAEAIAQKKVDDHEYREFAQRRALYWDR